MFVMHAGDRLKKTCPKKPAAKVVYKVNSKGTIHTTTPTESFWAPILTGIKTFSLNSSPGETPPGNGIHIPPGEVGKIIFKMPLKRGYVTLPKTNIFAPENG